MTVTVTADSVGIRLLTAKKRAQKPRCQAPPTIKKEMVGFRPQYSPWVAWKHSTSAEATASNPADYLNDRGLTPIPHFLWVAQTAGSKPADYQWKVKETCLKKERKKKVLTGSKLGIWRWLPSSSSWNFDDSLSSSCLHDLLRPTFLLSINNNYT